MVEKEEGGDLGVRAVGGLSEAGAGEVVVSALLAALHDVVDKSVRRVAAASLDRVVAGNEAEMSYDLLAVRLNAAEILGQVGAGNEAVVSALLQAALHDADKSVRRAS